jgi:hypothetical protein
MRLAAVAFALVVAGSFATAAQAEPLTAGQLMVRCAKLDVSDNDVKLRSASIGDALDAGSAGVIWKPISISPPSSCLVQTIRTRIRSGPARLTASTSRKWRNCFFNISAALRPISGSPQYRSSPTCWPRSIPARSEAGGPAINLAQPPAATGQARSWRRRSRPACGYRRRASAGSPRHAPSPSPPTPSARRRSAC